MNNTNEVFIHITYISMFLQYNFYLRACQPYALQLAHRSRRGTLQKMDELYYTYHKIY
jgi:hypothetical protein